MLTAEGCAARRERLWGALPSPCDVLIVGDPSHLNYFAGYSPSPFVFELLSRVRCSFWSRDGPRSSPIRWWGRSSTPRMSTTESAPVWYDGQHSAPYRRGLLIESTVGRLAAMPGSRVGVELAAVPAGVVDGLRAARPQLEIVDIGPLVRRLRRAKHADEVAVLRRSMLAGEAGLAAALEKARPGMTELDVYLIVQNAAMTALGEQVIVYGDFASGPRCARDKGGSPTARKIEPGDLLLIDFSVIVSGYRGDFTNTFAVGGGPTSGQRELFEACGRLKAGEAALKPGTAARDVDGAVRGHFRTLGLDGYFPTHSGHGLGLGHPEPPYFVPESSDTLQAGDVVALEPGLYVEGTGGMRYERNYLITPGGFETLSHHEIRITQ